MKITDKEYNIKQINNVYKGETTVQHLSVPSREEDGFIYLLSGSAVYSCFNKEFYVEAGDVFYLSKGSSYEIAVTQFPFTYICINFLFEKDTDSRFDCEVFKFKSSKSLESPFIKAKGLWQALGVAERIMCRSVLLQIYSDIVKNELYTYVPYSKIQKMQTIIFEIEKSYADPDISVASLSEIYGSSEAHFRRTFQQIYKLSPQKYISELRLSKAKELLLDTDIPINKVAEKCGFASTYYFDRVFKSANGITPMQYRKRDT